jgi:ammonia channel protein AmtB
MGEKAIIYFVAKFSALIRSFVQVARDKVRQRDPRGLAILLVLLGPILLIIAWVTDFNFGVGP